MKPQSLSQTDDHRAKKVERRYVSPWLEQHENDTSTLDFVATEHPIAMVYNGVSHAVMMASPEDLIDFAIGFSFAEGIIDSYKDIFSIDIIQQTTGIELQLQISQRNFAKLKQQRRQLMGKTGCGICGIEALQQIKPSTKPVNNELKLTHQSIQYALNSLEQQQGLQFLTGASHAAAWCDIKGNIQLIREDIGRHNALDKLIGARQQCSNFVPGFAMISSRASYEMVQKAMAANIEALVAVSAATTLAIDTANACGMTLIGFGRNQRHVVYTGHGRVA
ncbi:MAG: formate dehydrogenase accessory sulfurtransferase FdhD [Pseudomonadales bacterium]|nr:formate dehydrogenase accessory sulfurtransferase FdhD [Pseudomonadales bacterium]